jgi:hypothetical protein
MVAPAAHPRSDHEQTAPPGRAELLAANINPETGLANDYLNQFNEAIMMLELMAGMPECAEHLLAWQPRTYREHFAASKLKHRALALAAYETAQTGARQQLDELGQIMNDILVSVRETLRVSGPQHVIGLSAATAAHLRRLVSRASAVINGGTFGVAETQAAVDALLDR